MLPRPTKYSLVSGVGDCKYKLNAFDMALLDAGVGNLNLLKVSSILPPQAERVEKLVIPPGTLTPVAYGTISSDVKGELIAASVAIGLSEDTYGVIMEFSGKCSKEEAEEKVCEMVKEAFKIRDLPLVGLVSEAIEHRVEECGCAFAGVVLWY
ncbi:MAG: arginine decarboxylase [Halanaerobiales bacterium]|nr:arginine decarboxylase [Halanaerobiales bacterium]